MMRNTRGLDPLKPEQASAAAPDVHAWVAASAGTGKTQVLSARVLRLLLQGTPPHAILCLTFTKLAAAEMQTRVFDRLAWWAICDDEALAADLRALRSGDDPDVVATARRLFLDVLDAPQGLAVQTIHAFAQGLIASFPVEAGVAPGFATLDDRGAALLRQRLLTEAIQNADADDDKAFLDDLAHISITGGESRLIAMVSRLAGHGEALADIPLAGFEPMLRRGFGLPSDGNAAAEAAAAVDAIDHGTLATLAEALKRDPGVNAHKLAASLKNWLAAPAFDTLVPLFLTQKDEPRKTMVPKSVDTAHPAMKKFCADTADRLLAVLQRQQLYAAAAHAACHLRIGKRLAADWRLAKSRLGVVDYDDMIAAAERLLLAPGAAEWVRYKLDQRIDHILVDEAQDTNARQWEIVRALTRAFYDGEGARDTQRTLFVVGDFKQAIFSFQGSNPQIYRDQRDTLEQWARDSGELWRDVGLTTNFRSVPAVLQVVDAVADTLGHTPLDKAGVPIHVPHREDAAGSVTLWPPVIAENPEDDEDGEDEEPGRPAKTEVQLAHQIARQIARWLDPRAPLILPDRGRPVAPQDILVLVRSRSGFSGALVAALHEFRVPVAGVDRLKLTDPLAVADLLATARFALQPADDLTLAALLVSPFIGLDFDKLFTLSHARPGTLWERVTASDDPRVIAARDWLRRVLGFADFAAPYEFFERILSAPDLSGRRRLLARLGEEARDAIDAILDQALAFEAANPPSLQAFLAWIDSDDIEIKRDPDAPLDAVRLMTVHGAKGLQAPVVILADATRKRKPERDAPLLMQFDNGPVLPVFLAGRKGLGGPLGDAIADADADAEREHCRLLYVALTRAEDLLFIGGALTGKAEEAPEGSWHHIVGQAMDRLAGTDPDELTGARTYRSGTDAPRSAAMADLVPDSIRPLPAWATHAPVAEPRPPRPLSPSTLAADDVSAPPQGAAARAAARRGSALHALFERLPDIAPDRRRAAGEAWCRQSVPELDATALTQTVLAILDDPQFAAVFAAEALAEAPIAARVGDIVIAGTVDRLLITPDKVTIVDFKTGRRVPATAEEVEPYYLRQMSAYVAAIEQVFPGRHIAAALLYSEGPRLITLPPALLQLHRPKEELGLNGTPPTPISEP